MPLKIAYINFGKGSGGLVLGTSLFNGLKRCGVDVEYTAITDNAFSSLIEPFHKHIKVKIEPEKLFRDDRGTELYRAIESVAPDVIIVFSIWLPLYGILDDFRAQKIFLISQMGEPWFHVPLSAWDTLHFEPGQYDKCFSIEPGFVVDGCENINPVVIRNRDEIFSPARARALLDVPDGQKLAVVSQNGYLGELEKLLSEHRESLDEYKVLLSTNRRKKGLFPLVDYAGAIDLLISGAGYCTFYEARYFGIRSKFLSFGRNAEDTSWRIEHNGDFTFRTNGADQIAGYIRENT